MIAVVTLLVAIPAGYYFKSRLAANMTYAVAYLWAFVYQTLYLVLDSFGDTPNAPAFEPSAFPWAYGVATLAIFATGFGLVAAGHLVADSRRVPVAA